MSEELVMLKEYYDSLGLGDKEITQTDLDLLKNELKDAGELGLANFVAGLSSPQALLDYISE